MNQKKVFIALFAVLAAGIIGYFALVGNQTPTAQNTLTVSNQQEPKTEPKSVFFEQINLHSDWRLKWSFNYSTSKGIFRNENELKKVFGSIVNAHDEEQMFWGKKHKPQPVMPVIDFGKYSVVWYADGGSKASGTRLKEVFEYDDSIEVHVTLIYDDWDSSHLNLWTIPKTEKDIRFVETKEYLGGGS